MRLAVIGTFYGRHENSFPLLHRLLVDSTRKPDEAWLMCETRADADALNKAYDELLDLDLVDPRTDTPYIYVLPTPREDNGNYAAIPYSNKINWALDRQSCDLVCYLDNGSMPGPYKYALMAGALRENPDWGAVYCGQKREGMENAEFPAEEVVGDAYCVLNYTQVMHRKTDDRWPTSMMFANPDMADATFWRMLHVSLGPFYPVQGVHDWHRIDGPQAQGL